MMLLFSLSNEMCLNQRFFLWQTVFFLAKSNALHQERHVSCQSTHGLFSFAILSRFSTAKAVNVVPILAGCNRHTGNGKELIQFIEGRRTAASSCTDNACAHFHRLVKMSIRSVMYLGQKNRDV